MGKWKSRIWKNPDANTETETKPEVDRLTGSSTRSDPGSVLFYFPLFFLNFFLTYFLSYCVNQIIEFWPATVVCSVWEASPAPPS